MTGETGAKVLAPAHIKATVGGFQRCDCARRARPAAGPMCRWNRSPANCHPPAPAQPHPAWTDISPAGVSKRRELSRSSRAICDADGRSRRKKRRRCQPGVQNGRSFHPDRENPVGSADEGFDAETTRPGYAPAAGRKAGRSGSNLRTARAVTGEELFEGFGVGQVQAALASQQEFTPHGRHGVVEVDLHPALDQYFGGHQPGRAAADDSNRFTLVRVDVMMCG